MLLINNYQYTYNICFFILVVFSIIILLKMETNVKENLSLVNKDKLKNKKKTPYKEVTVKEYETKKVKDVFLSKSVFWLRIKEIPSNILYVDEKLLYNQKYLINLENHLDRKINLFVKVGKERNFFLGTLDINFSNQAKITIEIKSGSDRILEATFQNDIDFMYGRSFILEN